jgi:hypothetical protein
MDGLRDLTSDWQLRTTSNKLKEFTAFFGPELAHDLKQIAYAPTVEIETVIRLDGVHERFCHC